MSAAIASRAQAPLSAIIRQAFKGLRQSTRIVEGIEALPSAGPSQRADWGRIARARVGVASIYFPMMGTFLTWPLISSHFLDGHMGQF
ncbi:uncharacterized protein F4807DRAFT_292351 [Annulohypoxylon truncatum]|uniref:uncharacterized protein n=1 Tax=Annulohypoxylon truncatum TaxID=327061 RepID=UPI0020073DAA|nr:uncharacterized protein F4807DRAFT_292351 [Annulohypoxylon truncatum]KAI1205118.1 hypothetical protein F4807DRAFT_292351 [Annulohypoxylon truncatum]